MTKDDIRQTLDIIYGQVFNEGRAELYPDLVSGPYIQHNPQVVPSENVQGFLALVAELDDDPDRWQTWSGFCGTSFWSACGRQKLACRFGYGYRGFRCCEKRHPGLPAQAFIPPSTVRLAPVMYEDSGPATNATIAATSSARP